MKNNIENKISTKENMGNSEKSVAEQLDGLQNILNTREGQSELAKVEFGIDLEKINHLARIEDAIEIIHKNNKREELTKLAFNTMQIRA